MYVLYREDNESLIVSYQCISEDESYGISAQALIKLPSDINSFYVSSDGTGSIIQLK